MLDKEKTIYYLQGGLMILIFISPYLFHQYRMPFYYFDIYEILAIVFGSLGIFFSVATLKAMGPSFETKPRPKKEGKLIKSFPFSFSRNPMYVGGFFLTLSWSFGHKSLMTFVFALILQFVLVKKILIEEELLEEKFGEEYLKYKKNTPRWLFF